MFSSRDFHRFKTQNLSKVIDIMEMEDRQNGARGSEPFTQVPRLARIHRKLRIMYLEGLASEAILIAWVRLLPALVWMA